MLRSGLLAFASLVGVILLWSVIDTIRAVRKQYATDLFMTIRGRSVTPSTLGVALAVGASVFLLTR